MPWALVGRTTIPSGLRSFRLKAFINSVLPRPLHGSGYLHSQGSEAEPRSTVCLESEAVKVTLASGRSLRFPWLWLRDNCQCAECFNPKLQSRTIDWRHFDLAVKPNAVACDKSGRVSVEWSDGHSSSFESKWLQERSFAAGDRQQWLQEHYRPRRQPWDAADFPRILKRLHFDDVINSDARLLEWLEALAVHGVALLEGAPPGDERARQLAQRVAFIKRTHYGEEFEVRNKPDTTNVAYLSTPLQMHTDLPYYEYKPGVNLLHCTMQAENGAANLLVDGLCVSEALRTAQPQLHATLVRTVVDWADDGADGGRTFLTLHRAPALCEDAQGEVIRINYSQQQRASHFCVSAETALQWYKAHHAFTQLLYKPEFLVRIKTRVGDVLTFDNVRLLHGREGYHDIEGSERRLIGAYLDWDLILSRMRVLKTRVYSDGKKDSVAC